MNNKIYIGSSSDILQRWASHRYRLNNNKHPNPNLFNSYKKYGLKSFVFEIIEECEQIVLIDREIYWADFFKKKFQLFNCGEFLDNPTRGIKLSEEHKRKMSIKLLGKPNINKGKKLPDWWRERISKGLIGSKMSKKNNDILMKFRKMPHSQEQKNKQSLSMIKVVGVKVICLQTSESFNSLSEAAKKYNTRYQAIRQSILRGGKCCGLNFYYANAELDEHKKEMLINSDLRKRKKSSTLNKKVQTELYGKKIFCAEINRVFNSISETAEYFSSNSTTIRNYITNKKKIKGEYTLNFI